MDDVKSWTKEQEWQRVNQVMELVKQEGDANCEAAFDFLLRTLAAAYAELVEAKRLNELHAKTVTPAEYVERELASARAEVERLRMKSDAEMLRVKACEHIAEGDDGWEALRNECPSTAAVSRLRDSFVTAQAEVQQLRRVTK